MQHRYGFVVLNYKNYQETLACVSSILAIPGDEYAVVVVDNASPNDSYEQLSAAYANHPKVTVLASGANGGYSFGNNRGIDHLAQRGIHEVIIATSDTLVVSTDILKQLSALSEPDVGVIGPRVQNLGGQMQNPMLERVNISYVINIFLPPLAAFCRKVVYAVRGLRRSPGAGTAPAVPALPINNTAREVYMIHGCFLFLTSEYLRRCGPLDETLFMYGEEDLLAYNAFAAGLRTLYAPGIEVIHKEAMSTPKENNNEFFNTNSKTSIAYLQKCMRISVLFRQFFSSHGAS